MKKETAFQVFHQFMKKICNLPEEEWSQFLPYLGFVKIEGGERLITQGDKTSTVHFVVQGLLKTYFSDKEGAEAVKGFAWEGSLASPYVALLTGQASNFSVMALESSICVTFDYNKTKHLYARHSCWQEFGRKVAEKLLIDRERREFQMLMLPAKQRYAEFLINFPHLEARIPQYEIASYIGVTPVALSNLKKKTKV